MEVKFDLDKAIDTIKGWWESDIDIEIDTLMNTYIER